MEVLVIDDGSTDGTRALVEERYGMDPRVKYTYQPNRGVAAARNEGLRQAQGEFIAFLDSDDVWLPGKLRLQLECLDAVPEAGMVWTDMEAVDLDHRLVHPRYLRVMYHAYRNFPRHQDLFSRQPGPYVDRSPAPRSGEASGSVPRRVPPGAPDAITRPELQADFASAYLVTLQETLARDRDRIALPEGVIRRCLTGACESVGRAALDAGRAAEARSMYWRSLRLNPFEWESLKFLAVAALPERVRVWLRNVVLLRRARGRRGRSAPASAHSDPQ